MSDFTDGNQNKKVVYVLNPCPANEEDDFFKVYELIIF